MAKKISALQLDAVNPSDLITLAVGNRPAQLNGTLRDDGIITEIVHNEGGLAGIYKHRMKSCYRVGLDTGVNIVVPSDEVKFVITTEDNIVGG